MLLLGESGVGKELAARAIHSRSKGRGAALIARSAATLPAGLVDAELFGNLKNYPNPGMAERAGLIGEANGSTLFLDEIGELPQEAQAHLLRVLDSGGEYHRLGEAKARTSSFRLIAATNRAADELKHDFRARFTLSAELPSLNDRREDVPLLARHVLRRLAAADPTLGERFFDGWPAPGSQPRLEPTLMEQLVRHRFTLHLRELESLLLAAIAGSPGKYLALAPVASRLDPQSPQPARAEPTREEIEACLARNGGNVSRAWSELGLSSRDALNRLIRKLGISVSRSKPS